MVCIGCSQFSILKFLSSSFPYPPFSPTPHSPTSSSFFCPPQNKRTILSYFLSRKEKEYCRKNTVFRSGLTWVWILSFSKQSYFVRKGLRKWYARAGSYYWRANFPPVPSTDSILNQLAAWSEHLYHRMEQMLQIRKKKKFFFNPRSQSLNIHQHIMSSVSKFLKQD